MERSTEQVRAFVQARSDRPHWFPVPTELRPATRAEGYSLQRNVYEALFETGVRQVGYKIGCTSPESQGPFGLDEPIYAGIFQHTQFPSLREALSIPLIDPKIECEVAVRLAHDIEAANPSDEQLLSAIGEIYVACEVVDNRYDVPPPAIGAPTLLSDDFLHAGFVLGEPCRNVDKILLHDLKTEIIVGDIVHTEPAPHTLPPLASLRWLANKLRSHGEFLREGQIIMTGSVLRPVAFRFTEKLTMTVAGLGSLSL